ncbi:MAG: glycosyltransferase family A protein [Bryobacteraceae bacterium]|nr:glycosyltransferase family A protein [Bryobacteraceae bacterium]
MRAPLVSCILPTRNRTRFLRQALQCYEAQRWPRKELIVVDDGERSNAALFRGGAEVRYIRLTQPVNLGQRVNLAIEAARGDIIQRLDDDDYYGPEFLARNMTALPLDEGRDRSLVTRCCFLVLLRRAGDLRHSGHGWRPGGAFCFHKDLWRRIPFRDAAQSEDSWFIRDQRPRLIRVCRVEDYIVVRHGGNHWTRVTTGDTDEYFGQCELFGGDLASVTSAETARWYQRCLGR